MSAPGRQHYEAAKLYAYWMFTVFSPCGLKTPTDQALSAMLKRDLAEYPNAINVLVKPR